MTIKRLDHVSVVVEDLAAARAFFTALGMTVEGEMPVEGAVGGPRQRARRCPGRHRYDADSRWAREARADEVSQSTTGRDQTGDRTPEHAGPPIAVGTPVTRCPPHRSRRAVFPHRVRQTYSLSSKASANRPGVLARCLSVIRGCGTW